MLQTLYIDVYFLINFTVDILAFYFAAMLSKVPTNTPRLLISSILGAVLAVTIVFLPENAMLKLVCAGISLILISFFAVKRVSLRRKIKFTFAFLIFEALVGGGAYFLWGILDKYMDGKFEGAGGAANRKLLFFSVIVLLSIGVFKMIVSFFSNIESEGSVEIEIRFQDRMLRTEAFIDSGNLAVDPMDMRPVLLIKESVARDLFPENVINLHDPDLLERNVRRRIRLIPISNGGTTHVLTGIKADSVKIVNGNKFDEISVTVAIDKEGGSYGGFEALMPSAVIGDAVRK